MTVTRTGPASGLSGARNVPGAVPGGEYRLPIVIRLAATAMVPPWRPPTGGRSEGDYVAQRRALIIPGRPPPPNPHPWPLSRPLAPSLTGRGEPPLLMSTLSLFCSLFSRAGRAGGVGRGRGDEGLGAGGRPTGTHPPPS